MNVTAPFAASRNVSVSHRAATNAQVAIGKDRLTQIIANLIDNAVKYGREGGHIEISTIGAGRFLDILVNDDGPGVPLHEREVVFGFAKRGSNLRVQGSGIGLAVARLMLERIGGEIGIDDAPDGGARFRIRLPKAPKSDAASL